MEARRLAWVQPDSRMASLPTGEDVMLGHYRVSDRVAKSILTVAPADLLYHELDSEVDPELMRLLDEPLYLRDKLKDVYTYLAKSMNDDFLNYTPPETDSDIVTQSVTSSAQIANIFNSTCIRNGNIPQFSRVILNSDLVVASKNQEEVASRAMIARMVCRYF